jgi:hypothetical protein
MRIWYFIDAIAIIGIAFAFAFLGLAAFSPDTLEHVVCSIRTDSAVDYNTCRQAI